MKSISITLLLCFSFGLIQRANAQDNCETLTAKVNALYIQLNTQKNTQNNCVMQKNAATESWKAAKNRRDKNGMATAELAANSAEQQWKAAGTEIDKTNRSIKFAEERQKTVCKKERDAERFTDGVPSMKIMSVGWYPKGTTTILNRYPYDIGGFTEQQRISLKSISDTKRKLSLTADEYNRIKPLADKNLRAQSEETSRSTSIANPSPPPASGVMPPKPTAPAAPKSAAVGTVAPTPPPATTTSTPKAPPLSSTPPPAIPNTPSTSPNTIVPQNEAQKKELELRQMQTAEAIKNKQTTTTAPSTFGGTAPAATSTSSSFGTAPASAPANNPSSATASNPTTTSNPTAAPKTGGYGSNASTTTPANTAASNQYPASTPKTGQAGLIEGIPSQTINSYGWYPRGTSMMLQSKTYDISGFTQVDVDRLRSTSGRYSNPARTRSEYDAYKLKTAKTLESSDRQDAQKDIVFSGNEPWLKAIREATDPNFESLADNKKSEMRQMKANYTGNNKYIPEAYDRNIKTIDAALFAGEYKKARPVKKAWMDLAESKQNVVFVMTGQNQILKQDYLKFCKAGLSTENNDFYEAWTSQRQTGTISREWSLAAYNRFISATAPQQLNIPTSLFDNANLQVAQPVDAKGNGGYVSFETYEMIFKEITALMERDSFFRWRDAVKKNER